MDVWDALSHDRPYREAWPEARVRSHLTALAGTHLDPDVVAALDRTLGSESDPWRAILPRPDSDVGHRPGFEGACYTDSPAPRPPALDGLSV